MNLNLNIATVATSLPANVSPAGVSVSLADATGNPAKDVSGNALGSVSLAKAPFVASFGNVPDGEYVATAAAVDTSGATIGTPVTQAFTLTTTPNGPTVTLPTPPATTYDAPSSITVTVS